MGPERLKTFTDGVLAIIITIMVLELRAPHDAALTSLRPLVPVVLSYALSFVYERIVAAEEGMVETDVAVSISRCEALALPLAIERSPARVPRRWAWVSVPVC